MTRRVVVTGTGLITPLGNSVEDTWAGLVNGKSGISTFEEWKEPKWGEKPLPVTIAGQVKDFDGKDWVPNAKDVRRMDIFIQFAMAAAHQAWQQAGLPEELSDEQGNGAGCIIGVGLGGMTTIIDAWETLRVKGARRVSAFAIPALIGNDAPGYITMRYNLRNANWAPASACASGAHGIGEAAMHIITGRADMMLAGGSEAALHPVAVGGFNSMHAVCKNRNDDPEGASRPFEKNRSGFVMGEGAGMMVLEEYEHAKARGADIICELVGYGSTSDANHITAPADEGEGAQRAMRQALKMAGMNPEDIGYVNAHGTSTALNDKFETQAIKGVFGDHAKKLPVSSTKSMTGHLLGGAGGVEAVISALALSRGVLPPTINYEEPDPECDLDYVPNTAREQRVQAVMSNSFGFGGTNAVLAFKRM
jgi:3-oxoacyl-[acyl-carrier-protein] synthase II